MQELKFEQVEVVSGGVSSGPFIVDNHNTSGPNLIDNQLNAQDGGGSDGVLGFLWATFRAMTSPASALIYSPPVANGEVQLPNYHEQCPNPNIMPIHEVWPN